MKKLKRISIIAIALSLLFSFNSFAYNSGLVFRSGFSDEDGNSAVNCWAWIEQCCYHFDENGEMDKAVYVNGYGVDSVGRWTEKIDGTIDSWKIVERTVFTGKWNVFEDGNKTFSFDDGTIAIGYQKIDEKWYYFKSNGVLALNYKTTYGTSDNDGIISELIPFKENKFFLADVEEMKNTIPACTSHK